MVVDDEQDILTVIKSSLQTCKDSVLVVEAYPNPFVALEKFRQNPSSYSLVLTDIRMPNMNGFQFARNIKNVCGGILYSL
jgi:CheY-like chemotaxis protein